MSPENYGCNWTFDHCYPLSKTKLFNEKDMLYLLIGLN